MSRTGFGTRLDRHTGNPEPYRVSFTDGGVMTVTEPSGLVSGVITVDRAGWTRFDPLLIRVNPNSRLGPMGLGTDPITPMDTGLGEVTVQRC